MRKEKLSLFISCSAVAMSIIAICTSLNSFSVDETAYLGWIVAVLSTLVVVLIGWQIYSFFDFKESNKKVESIVELTDHLICSTNVSTAMALSDYYYRMLTNDERDILFKFLHYSIIAVMHASGMKDFKICNAIVKAMLEVIVKPEMLKLSKYNKDLIFDIISKVRYGNEIERYKELMQVLAKIETH
jgi:hypothetical protein